MKYRIIDLFSGIGGISLGLESTGGFETAGFCEIEAFPREVLTRHWPEVPIHEDIKTLSVNTVGWLRDEVSKSGGDNLIVAGGFPCQDISVAGKGVGIEGARSGLWKEMYRIISECRPRWVLAENVPALRTRGADRVLGDLEGAGYSCWSLVVGAWAVGAPHKRERVWIVAHRHSGGPEIKLLDGERSASGDDADGRGEWPVGDSGRDGLEGQRAGRDAGVSPEHDARRALAGAVGPRWPARPGEPQHEWEEPRLAYGECGQRGNRVPERVEAGHVPADATRCSDGNSSRLARRDEEAAESVESPTQLPLGCSVDGLPERLVRRTNREALKALGNSVVPQVVEIVGYAILEADKVAR